jgi:hypothetical protein
MSFWVKVKWIDPLFAAFNALNPNRSKTQDGTIGDTAHQAETSGHNPDDTAGVKAERSDTDSVPEVRAADVDSRGVNMEAAVQRVLATPSERDRLIYIIFNHRIWRKANGWRQEAYTGSDPHELHAHFSGDPASDEDGRPWTSITGDDMTPEQDRILRNVDTWLQKIGSMAPTVPLVGPDGKTSNWANQLAAAVTAAAAPINVQALADALAAELGGGVTASQVVLALQSDAGQAALTGAANKAEDS